MSEDHSNSPRYATASLISEILKKNYKDARLPASEKWLFLAAQIKEHQSKERFIPHEEIELRRSKMNVDMKALTKKVRESREHRRTLKMAAHILESDMNNLLNSPSFAEQKRRYLEAIQILRLHRDATDNQRDLLTLISKQGPEPKYHTYIAREIASYLVPVLCQKDTDGLRIYDACISNSPSSPFIKCLFDLTSLIFFESELPGLKGFAKDLTKAIKKLKKDNLPPY